MEMIPLDDRAAEPSADAPAAPEATAAGREPLVVESLENRVLLAADAVPIADAPATEPAPYVAAPQTHHLEIDLQDLAETAEASGSGNVATSGAASGHQAAHAEPHQPEAEKVEYRNENAVEAVSEKKDPSESEANRNEFGLATIEPPRSKAEAAASRIGRELLEQPTENEPQAANAEADMLGRASTESASETQSPALSRLAGEVAEKLDGGLLRAVSLEANVGSAPAADVAAKSGSADDEAAVVAQTVLKSQPLSETAWAEPAQPAVEEIASSAQQQTVESPQVPEYNAEPLAETPAAAHDALFSGGQGVEAVLERSSA